MGGFAEEEPVPGTLTRMTDIGVLPGDRVVQRRGDHLVIRSPGNPTHWWGNYLLFDDPPRAGDGERWEAAFAAAFPTFGAGTHRAFGWDRGDGAEGEVTREFVDRGYLLERGVGLVATPAEIRPHPRANREVAIHALDPAPGAEEERWEQAIAVQLAGNAADGDPIPDFEDYVRTRMRDIRALVQAGRSAWYVAVDPDGEEVVAACGVIALGSLGRFQAVDTAPTHRRRGICRRLVAEAARHVSQTAGLARLMIVAEAGYHALGIYQSLGFSVREHTSGVTRPPGTALPRPAGGLSPSPPG